MSARLGLQDLLRVTRPNTSCTRLPSLCQLADLTTAASQQTGSPAACDARKSVAPPYLASDSQVGEHPHSISTSSAQASTSSFAAASINQQELHKFAQLADEWWHPQGAFAALHAMNPTRCKFIRDALCQRFNLDPLQPEPFKDRTFLDVGCGGGILSEALARMGASVTGIEPQQDNIKAAIAHAESDPAVAERTTYMAVTAEELASTGKQFDAVMGLEIIEHVAKPADFIKTLSSLTKSDGALFVSTINRTPRGYLLAILGAERIAGVLPEGTHDWHSFVTPEELHMLSEESGLEMQQVAGMVMNPMTGRWSLSPSVAVNYIAYFSKLSLRDRVSGSLSASTRKAADVASA